MYELLNQNLKTLLKKHRLTSKQLADITGVPLPTISRLRNEHDVNPTVNSLIPICQHFKVSLDQLLGIDSFCFNSNSLEFVRKINAVPLLSWENVPHFVSQKSVDEQSFIYTELPHQLALYALKVPTTHGDIFHENSIIFISTSTTAKNGDYVIVYSIEDHLVGIKQLITDIDGIYLKSLNDNLHPIKLSERYKISGVIFQERKNFVEC
ncbi:MAG: S24 family peptidase [Gammaproteobacteria bacterium]